MSVTYPGSTLNHMFRFRFSQTCPICWLPPQDSTLTFQPRSEAWQMVRSSFCGWGKGSAEATVLKGAWEEWEERGSTHGMWFPIQPTPIHHSTPTMCPSSCSPPQSCCSHHGCAVFSVSQAPSISLEGINFFIRLLWKLNEVKYRQVFLYF